MSEIKDTRELVKEGHLNSLKKVFFEPSRLSWLPEDFKQLEDLYAIALMEDPEDPVQWIMDFNASHPYHIEVGVENTRLGKMLYMAKLYIDKQNLKEQRKSINKREF